MFTTLSDQGCRVSFKRKLQTVVPVYADPTPPSTALFLALPQFRRRRSEKTIIFQLPWTVLAPTVEAVYLRPPPLWMANRRHGWRKSLTPTTLDEYTEAPGIAEQPETAFRLPPSLKHSSKRRHLAALLVPEWPLAQSSFPAILLEKALRRFALGRKLQRLPTHSEYAAPYTQPASARPVTAWQWPLFRRRKAEGRRKVSWVQIPDEGDFSTNQFTFVDITADTLGIEYESNIITVAGLIGGSAAPLSFSETGHRAGYYSLDGGAWTDLASIIVAQGQTLQLKLTSSAYKNIAISITVTIGLISDTWTVTTSETYSQGGTGGDGSKGHRSNAGSKGRNKAGSRKGRVSAPGRRGRGKV